MLGVDILAIEQVAVAWDYDWTAFWTALVGILIISVFGGIVMSIHDGDWVNLLACVIVGLLIGGLLSIMIGSMCGIPTEHVNQYKVTVSDEVSMNEFNEQYKIIDQEGKIYTVRERNNEE